MASRRSALAGWSPEQVARGRRWVEAWRNAAPELERIRRQELRAELKGSPEILDRLERRRRELEA